MRSRPARPGVDAETLSIRAEVACGEEKLAPGAVAAREIITTRSDLNEFFIAHTTLGKTKIRDSSEQEVNQRDHRPFFFGPM